MLALEIPLARWSSTPQLRSARVDRNHVPRKQIVGTERSRGELLKLGINISNRSIRRYGWRGPARPPSQTWRTFLTNHAHHLWTADLFTAAQRAAAVRLRRDVRLPTGHVR
jgi:hypothetical protein